MGFVMLVGFIRIVSWTCPDECAISIGVTRSLERLAFDMDVVGQTVHEALAQKSLGAQVAVRVRQEAHWWNDHGPSALRLDITGDLRPCASASFAASLNLRTFVGLVVDYLPQIKLFVLSGSTGSTTLARIKLDALISSAKKLSLHVGLSASNIKLARNVRPNLPPLSDIDLCDCEPSSDLTNCRPACCPTAPMEVDVLPVQAHLKIFSTIGSGRMPCCDDWALQRTPSPLKPCSFRSPLSARLRP
jgi:hypothetical protein